jgi:CubicO group peptidase (beta-lactamase class C family)
VAATKLINKQLLSLDDTLTELLPELTEKIKNPDKFTVRSLLKIYFNTPAFYEIVKNPILYNTESLQEIYSLFPYNSYDFDSAIEFNYHNINTLLVAEIFLRKLGYDYRQYIKNEILIPLKLDKTYNMVSDVDLEKVENGNLLKFSKKMNHLDFIIPGYSMVASAEDLGKFLRALNDGVLLNEEEQIILSSIYNNEHTEGLIRDYQSIAKYHKNIDAVVVQFSNTTNYDSQRKSKIIYNRIIYNRIIKILRKDQEKISIKDTCY